MGEYRCELCWETFESPVALLEHEEAEEARVWFVDGLDGAIG